MQYQYNAKDELTQEKFLNNGGSPYVYNFAYDGNGNPTTFRNTARSYNDTSQLTSAGGYVYDGNGNPTTYKGSSYTYDAGDNPTAFGTALTAGYTSEGVRAWKQNSGGSTYFLYDGTDPVLEVNVFGAPIALNTFGANGLVSRYTPGVSGPAASTFYTFDETGNVSQRFDALGTILSTHGFQAYGQHGSTLSGNANPGPWGYKAQSGYYTDQETGLILCGLRYYDPANGRWINRDPIGYAGGLNLYGYCGGNPVMNVDPSGLIHRMYDAESVIDGGGGGGYANVNGNFGGGNVTGVPCHVAAEETAVVGTGGSVAGSGGSAALEKVVDIAMMAKTARDLYAFGNTTGPTGPRIGTGKDIPNGVVLPMVIP